MSHKTGCFPFYYFRTHPDEKLESCIQPLKYINILPADRRDFIKAEDTPNKCSHYRYLFRWQRQNIVLGNKKLLWRWYGVPATRNETNWLLSSYYFKRPNFFRRFGDTLPDWTTVSIIRFMSSSAILPKFYICNDGQKCQKRFPSNLRKTQNGLFPEKDIWKKISDNEGV